MQRVRSEIIGNRLCKALWMIVKTVAFILSDFERAKGDFWADELYDLHMSSADLRWLIFLPEILIPACASSSPAFLMMYSAYKLNKQGDNIQPWPTPFPIWNQSVVPCPVLAVASWPAYRFLKRQVRWSGIPISFRIFQSVETDEIFAKKFRLGFIDVSVAAQGSKKKTTGLLACCLLPEGGLLLILGQWCVQGSGWRRGLPMPLGGM